MRNIDFYDCEPLERNQIENLFNNVGFLYKNQSILAIRTLLQDEKENNKLLYFIFLFIPDFILRKILGIIPTLIYTIKRSRC
jgi:hypothetical protein